MLSSCYHRFIIAAVEPYWVLMRSDSDGYNAVSDNWCIMMLYVDSAMTIWPYRSQQFRNILRCWIVLAEFAEITQHYYSLSSWIIEEGSSKIRHHSSQIQEYARLLTRNYF